MPIFFAILLSLIASAESHAETNRQSDQPEYQRFGFTADNLSNHWEHLTGGMWGPLPTAESLEAEAARWPALYTHTSDHLSRGSDTYPELGYLPEGELRDNFEEYARQLRQTWALVFNGNLQAAIDLGLALGPAGYFPALYAQLLDATLVEERIEARTALLQEVIARAEAILPLAPGHSSIRFANAYGKARVLENLSASGALRSGYTSEVLTTLEALFDENPQHAYAIAAYAAVQAGIVEKAGSFIARMTYGASEASMKAHFESALALSPDAPAVYLEYARALLKLDETEHRKRALELLATASSIKPSNAGDALNIKASQQLAVASKN